MTLACRRKSARLAWPVRNSSISALSSSLACVLAVLVEALQWISFHVTVPSPSAVDIDLDVGVDVPSQSKLDLLPEPCPVTPGGHCVLRMDYRPNLKVFL